MTEKDFIKELITKKYGTLMDFSNHSKIGLSYLRTMLGGRQIMSPKNKERILQHLGLSVEKFKDLHSQRALKGEEEIKKVELKTDKPKVKPKLTPEMIDFLKKFHAAYAASDMITKYNFREAYNASFNLKDPA